MSPVARQLLREFAQQVEQEKRRQKLIQTAKDFAWIPGGLFLAWLFWLLTRGAIDETTDSENVGARPDPHGADGPAASADGR
jgi:hypothetical protein